MLGSAVEDVSSWVWLGAGIVAVFTGIYGAARWFKAQFRNAVTETVGPLLEPIREDLGHVHDCVERIGTDAVRNAQAATTAALEAKTAALDAKAAVAGHAELMEEHTRQDNASFAAIGEWRDRTDATLQSIQDAQAHDQSGAL